MILAIIASIISQLKRRAALKECLITDLNTVVVTFEPEGKKYAGKKYDRQKYLNYLIDDYSSLNTRQLNQMVEERLKANHKNHSDEVDIEIEALDSILKSRIR